jgi:hypothetical protein
MDIVSARPATARKEAIWLEARTYLSVQEIASIAGVSCRRVQQGLKRAQGLKLDLATVWKIEWIVNPNAFTAQNQCKFHGGPGREIPRELPIGCLHCLRSGLDHLIGFAGKSQVAEPSQDQPNGVPRFKPRGKIDE